MKTALILETSQDIPEEIRKKLTSDLTPIFHIKDRESAITKSPDSPTFIQIIGEVAQWITPLKATVISFLYHVSKQIAKRVADDIWDHKAEILKILKEATFSPMRQIAQAFLKLKKNFPKKIEITVGLPIPEEYFGTVFTFKANDEVEIIWYLANFINKVEEIDKAMQLEVKKGNKPLGRAFLTLQPNGSFIVRWKDQKEMKKHELQIK